MGVRLSIEIISPLEPDDRDMLTGLSIMVMAIANHELAKEHFPGIFPSRGDGRGARRSSRPCPAARSTARVAYCVSEVGHKGRHKYRPLVESIGLN